MAKKKAEKIVEEEAIVTEDIPVEETIEVQAPEVTVENSDGDIKTNEPSVQAPEAEEKVELEILIAFSDKYTNVDYTVGDVISFEKTRAKELLNDERKLVKKR